MKKALILFVIFLCTSLSALAQTNEQSNKLPDDFVRFFVGNWTGDGEFASGKKISADLTFKLSLDNCWLIYEHTDKLPNKYKALSMWGVDSASGEFVAYTFDNFQGHRKFASDGWKEGKLILTTNQFIPKRGQVFQHFIYEKLSDKSFKMTFETSNDGLKWKMVDYLTFTKK
jgi:hypothetical protein